MRHECALQAYLAAKIIKFTPFGHVCVSTFAGHVTLFPISISCPVLRLNWTTADPDRVQLRWDELRWSDVDAPGGVSVCVCVCDVRSGGH